MRTTLLFCLLLCCLFQPPPLFSQQKPKLIDCNQLMEWVHHSSDTLYVLHFWASWQGDWQKDSAHFERLSQAFQHAKVRIIMVNLDLKHVNLRLNRSASSMEWYTFNSARCSDMYWQEKIHPGWYGTLPATLLTQKKEELSSFIVGSRNYLSLKNWIEMMKQ